MIKNKNIAIMIIIVLVLMFGFNIAQGAWFNFKGKVKLGSATPAYSAPYPNTPSGIDGLNATACAAADWTWIADSDYNGVTDDPICVQPSRDAAGTKVWNNSASVNDNTFIGNYSCSDSESNLETFDAQLNGLVVENAGYGDDANTALALVDCKDGIRNLISKAEVESYGYTAPDATCTAPDYDDCHNGPLTPKILLEWKGTRLPTHNDFFDVGGDGTDSKTAGKYGVQIGRADSVITCNVGTYEWLSEQFYSTNARRAGIYACSYFHTTPVTNTADFRVVFRP
ncbi:MAG: hypothetical protein JW740_01930 [Candidatus Zambryskibacteria bacterium]|nr:hypothetical protein [Candidatus Zambryskibacteria bacterium]